MADNYREYFLDQLKFCFQDIQIEWREDFNLAQWDSYKMPYMYIYFVDDPLTFQYGDSIDYEGKQSFEIIIGAACNNNESIQRKMFKIINQIEVAIGKFQIDDKQFDDYYITATGTYLTRIESVANIGNIKSLSCIHGMIEHVVTF